MREFKNILIVRTDRIGDVILTTPSLKAIRKAYPQARITLLVAAFTQELMVSNPYVDEILIDDREGEHKGFGGFWSLVKTVRQKKFDCSIIFHTKKRTNLLCFLAKIPFRLGYKNSKYGFLLTKPVADCRHEGKKHEALYCLDVLNQIGITSEDYELYVSVQEESEQWVQQFLKQNNIQSQDKIVAVHVGASDPSKQWPDHRFSELLDMIYDAYECKIIMIGAASIRHLSRKVVSLSHAPILDLTGLTSLSQLVSIIKHSNLLVSNDSGPVHVASATQTPVVSIFTRNQPGINPERWKPLGAKSRVVSAPYDERPTFKKAGDADPKYLELIQAQQVFEAVDALFKL